MRDSPAHARLVLSRHRRKAAPAARRMTRPLSRSSDTGKTFDAAAEAARLREHTRARRRSRLTASRLDRYSLELLALHDAGSTTAELQRWLQDRRARVHHSTVARWLRRQLADG